jgi:glycosyltransferase involved in cell wall biosynthesis
MKIVILAPSSYPKRGGVEVHVMSVAELMVNRGHQVIILVRFDPDIPAHQELSGITILRLPQHDNLIFLALWLLRHPGVFEGVDAIHSHDYFPLPFKRFFPNTPWVHTFHGYEGYPLDQAAIKSRRNVRRITKYCVGVGQFIEKWYGTKLDYITYGAAAMPGKIAMLPHDWSVLYYGRLEPDTGFEDYLKGFKLIAQQHPDANMAVVGDGSLGAWASQFISDNKLRVDMIGWKADVWPYLKASKVICTSGYLSILETSLMSKPVVAHYATPIKKDYLECHPMADNFFIVNSPEEIAAAYGNAANEDTARRDVRQNWAQEQTWNKIVGVYEHAYHKVKGDKDGKG